MTLIRGPMTSPPPAGSGPNTGTIINRPSMKTNGGPNPAPTSLVLPVPMMGRSIGRRIRHPPPTIWPGISVTTTNKGPIAVAFDELCQLAEECGAKLSYEGVVMSGTPLIDMMKNGIAGCSVLGLEGILNGTTNFILTKMIEDGMQFDAALKLAQDLGFADRH